MSTPDSSRQAAVDALRGLAALAIVLFHYSGHSQRYFGDFPFFFALGKHGVELFFVISGFFIYSTIEKSAGVPGFLFQRFSRLYPAYWATLLILLAQGWLTGQPLWVGGYLANATMFQAFIGMPDLDIVFWSLATELCFYLLMALLLASGAIRQITAVCALWLAGSALTQLALPVPVETLAAPWRPWTNLMMYSPFFIGGIMLYRLKTRCGRQRGQALALLLASVGVAWSLLGTVLGLAALLFFIAVHLAANGRLPWLVWPLTSWLGAISYSLYLLHRNLGYALLFKLKALGLGTSLALGLTLAAALALATAVTYLIERPCLRWLRSRGAIRAPAVQPVSSS